LWFLTAAEVTFPLHSFQETELRRSPIFLPLVLIRCSSIPSCFSSVAFAIA
jgi:hypothetical protein